MKSHVVAFLAACAASPIAAHATFQQLWVDGVDFQGQCLRTPQSNSPVEDVTSSNMACNVGGSRGVSGKCPVKAGGVVTVEMHEQAGERSCSREAIGGQHYGPVVVYMAKVNDASTADGSQASWFKVYQNGWTSAGSGPGGNDNWGVKDLNKCCGKVDVPVPASLPDGDYLVRAEVIALHVASQPRGAQFYMSCYQITVTGGSGSSAPSGVRIPGAYSANDPGILFNIHGQVNSYTVPGPAVISGGRTATAGQGCSGGCQATCTPGQSTGTAVAPPPPENTGGNGGGGGGGGGGGCTVPQYGQCGGQGYTGCTTCASGFTCRDVSPPWYSQCS